MTQRREPLRVALGNGHRLDPVEDEVGAFGGDVDHLLPGRDRLVEPSLLPLYVAEVQIGRYRAGVELDRRFEPRDRPRPLGSGQSL